MSAATPHEGERWIVTRELPVHVTTHWNVAFTGGNDGVLPAGAVLVVPYDPPPIATAVGCDVEPYDELEPVLVPEIDRLHPNYAGYSVSMSLDEFGRSLRLAEG